MLLKQYSKVLYVTISTGIGTALVVDRVIDDNVGDAGGATMLLDFKGKPTPGKICLWPGHCGTLWPLCRRHP